MVQAKVNLYLENDSSKTTNGVLCFIGSKPSYNPNLTIQNVKICHLVHPLINLFIYFFLLFQDFHAGFHFKFQRGQRGEKGNDS